MLSNIQNSPVRGVKNLEEAKVWLRERNIADIECIVPDLAGVARGKMMPTEKFFSSTTLTMPSSIFAQTISGDYPEDDADFHHVPDDGDLFFKPDLSTLTVVPWESDPTAQLIHDTYTKDGELYTVAPRNVLKSVLKRYADEGLQPIIAPEVEFYLVKPNHDPDYPLTPPTGRSGRPEVGRQSYSISALNEFDELIDDIYDLSEAQGLEIDTLIHEEGAAQMEINLRHGDPLELADQVFLFKRTIREAALRHEMYATFMAKPMSSQPGSAMHIHQSLVDLETGQNIFSDQEGQSTQSFMHFIGGQQRFMPALTPIMAPYVNSYRRFTRNATAPTNFHWGHDNRTVGFRVPNSTADDRRLENRIAGSDANPYLVIAATLAAGFAGMKHKVPANTARDGNMRATANALPRTMLHALELFEQEDELISMFGKQFVSTYRAVKLEEYETFMSVISAWEREYLLLNV
ncbi:glutamine synthetase family protein [Polycladidibacter stylochi]|uniref:glutamine synthetase family protein n=1 Tax=Polycladidibacter stylochi TaxID=1807766 RepID=UPI00082A259A|nr:glutamine synthetase family protein [Pseudovibrio stylochi]